MFYAPKDYLEAFLFLENLKPNNLGMPKLWPYLLLIAKNAPLLGPKSEYAPSCFENIHSHKLTGNFLANG